MSIPMFSEKRLARRKKLTGLLPGKLCVKGQDQFVNCKPVDISTHGLGIISSSYLKPGMVLELHIKDRLIEFDVTWGQPDFGKNNLFRYGLIARDEQIDIEKIFEDSGCISST
jgi:hypothetical protein